MGERGAIVRIETRKLVPILTFNQRLRGQYFPLTYFAFTAHGTIYANDIPGNNGFETHQQLLSVSNGRIRLLWQETNTGPK